MKGASPPRIPYGQLNVRKSVKFGISWGEIRCGKADQSASIMSHKSHGVIIIRHSHHLDVAGKILIGTKGYLYAK